MCAARAKSTEPAKKKFLTVRIDEQLHHELAEVAAQNERTIAAELRVAARKHVAEHTPVPDPQEA